MRSLDSMQEVKTDPKTLINVIYVGASGHAACILPWIRSRVGKNVYMWHGPLALLILLLYPAFADCPEMLPYIKYWLGIVGVRRLMADRTAHSMYTGYRWLAHRFVRNERLAAVVEILIVFFAGVFLYPMSEPIGVFVMAGAGSMAIVHFMDMVVLRQRVINILDSRHEMEYLARMREEVMRGMR